MECANCGSTDELHEHHIVPVSIGGTERAGNKVILCIICHGKVHGTKLTRINLVKEGKRRAKEADPNWREGRPKKFSPAQLAEAIELLKYNDYITVQRITGMSKSTIRRYRMKG